MSAVLQNRDYTLIVDKSGSMGTPDVHGKSRWDAAREGTEALARKIQQFDPDGITLYTFSSGFNRYQNVTGEKVAQVWTENEPNGGTNLHTVLADALADYFKRKAAGQTKENGEMIVVVTDGEPNDRAAVAREIIAATQKMDRDEELAIGFIQIGKDSGATAYLKTLDDELVPKGAKFDIVDAVTQEESEGMTFVDLLTKFIND